MDAPEDVVPGRPHFYATSFPFRGYGQGMLVESHAGRPTKIDGNPDHPASLGATNVFAQASVLDLYDQHRSTTPLQRGELAARELFTSDLRPRVARFMQNGGQGLRLLTETVTSPTMGAQLHALLNLYPDAKWYRFDAVSVPSAAEGLERVFGRPVAPIYHLDRADVILAFDSDFLFALPGSVRYAHDWAARRRVREGAMEINRMYAVESTVSITGAMADHRTPLQPSKIEQVVRAVAARVGVADAPRQVVGVDDAWLDAAARDLLARSGSALVVAGETLAPDVHVLTHRMNDRLNAVGETVSYQEPVDVRPPGGFEPLEGLVTEMESGRVDTLVMLGGNPAYTAPADVTFEQALLQVPFSIHLAMQRDETSLRSTWHLPRTHFLEEWSDIRAFDGSPGIIQPLIAPLYRPCRSDHEILEMLMGRSGVSGYELVRTYWRDRMPEERFEETWRESLRTGVIIDVQPSQRTVDSSAAPLDTVLTGVLPQSSVEDVPNASETEPLERPAAVPAPDTPVAESTDLALPLRPPTEQRPDADISARVEIVFRPDATIWDGRFATNGWLQELPKPITKLTWDNAALISPDLSERLGVEREQLVQLTVGGRTIRAAVWIVPGHPDDTVSLSLGDILTEGGGPAAGNGFNAYLLRTSEAPWHARDAIIEPLPESYRLVSTQHHHSMEGRKLVAEADIGCGSSST